MNELTKALLMRCYNNEMIKEDKANNIMGDEEAIKQLCNETFGNGNVTPTTEQLQKFNNLLLSVADEVAKPQIEQVMNIITDFEKVDANVTLRQYIIPEECKVKFSFSAVGSQPDFKRVEPGKVEYSTPKYAQLALYYEPMTRTERCVQDFKKAVNAIAQAKVKLYYEELMRVFEAGATSNKIPANQIKEGSNLTLKEFKTIANRISRRANMGGVTFIADADLIDYFAMQQSNTSEYQLPESMKGELLKLHPTKILDVTSVNLVNPFTNKAGTSTFFPIGTGYLIGSSFHKPFVMTEFGGMVQEKTTEIVDGRVKLFARQGFAIDLLYGEAIAKITEGTVKLV